MPGIHIGLRKVMVVLSLLRLGRIYTREGSVTRTTCHGVSIEERDLNAPLCQMVRNRTANDPRPHNDNVLLFGRRTR